MAVADTPWWNPDSPQDGKPLRRNAPTLNQYHHPDQRQLERMRTGIGTPVIVPKATADGASPAFNANEPGVVHVDPDAPDGGAIVDLTHLNRSMMRKALSQSAYPHQVFYQLGVAPSALGRPFNQPAEPAPTRDNPLMPGGYVVPKAAEDGGQAGYYQHTPTYGAVAPAVVSGYSAPLPTPAYQVAQESYMNPIPPLPPLGGPQPAAPAPAPPQVQQYVPQPQYAPPQPQPYYPQPQYAPPAPAGPDPTMMAMMQQLNSTLSGLATGLSTVTQKVAAIEQAPRPNFPAPSSIAARARSRPAEDNPYAADARTNTFDDAAMRPIPRGQQAREEGVGDGYDEPRPARREEAQRQTLNDLREEPRDGIIVGFESLKLPYVIGPKGLKPKRQVFFELPGVGNHAVRYHDVVVGKNNLTLVYDTRYEDGDMYVPPELGESEIRVHVPHLKKTFLVSSMGLTFPLGVFDQVVLPKHGEEPLDMSQE